MQRLRKALSSNEPQEYEDFVVLQFGQLWFSSTYTRVINETGEIIGVQIASLDITERIVSERKLLQSEEKYRLLITQMAQGLAVHEVILDEEENVIDYRFIDVNHGFEELTGLNRENIIGKTVLEVIPGTEQTWLKNYGQVAMTGESLVFENFASGLGKWYEVIAYSPKPKQFATIFTDITKRKQIEAQLKQQNEDLLESQRVAHIGTWRLNIDTDQVVWSDELYKMYGFDPSNPPPPYTEHMKLFTPESWDKLAGALECTRKSGIPYELELKTLKADGSNGWMWARGEAKKDMSGNIISLWGAAQDITDRKRADESLAESQAFLQAAFDNSQAGIAIADAPDGKLRYVNKAGLMARNQSEEQLVKNVDVHKYVTSWNILHLDGTPYKKEEVPLTRAVLYGETCSEEFIIRRENFEDRVVFAKAAPIKDADNNIKAGIVVFLDITEKKQDEENIKKQNEIMASLFKVLPVGVFVVDATDGKPLLANEMAKDLLGRGILPDANQKNLSITYKAHKIGSVEPYPTEDMPIVKGMEGKDSHIDDMVVERPDGTEVLLEVFGTHITDANGKTWASLATFADITERTKNFADLEEALKFNQDIINSSSNGIIVYDTELRYKIFNPFMENMSGISAHEVIGRKAEEVFPWLKETGVIKNLEMALEGQHPDEIDFTFNLPETEKSGWARDQSGPLYNQSGDIVGVLGIVQNITEYKRSDDLLIEMNKSLALRLLQTINAISKISELRDVYTAGHQRKVADLACAIAKELGLSDEKIDNISSGALIHDIGKINIASDILNKPGKISNLEYQILQTHADFGYEIVKEIDFPPQVIEMIHQHHECLDGSGYPQKLAGDQIILESRILAVADVVEAMTSHRPYRPALGIDAALEEISLHRGKKYDCDVVDACIKLFREKGYQFLMVHCKIKLNS